MLSENAELAWRFLSSAGLLVLAGGADLEMAVAASGLGQWAAVPSRYQKSQNGVYTPEKTCGMFTAVAASW